MIEKEKIEAIKRGVDLKALVEEKGIRLKKNGKGYFGLCPFHADKNPSLSINPDKNLWQCFGCGAAGDVIRFVELIDNVDFKEAVNKLKAESVRLKAKPATASKPTGAGTTNLSAKLRKLLVRVIEFYHTAFGEDPRARQYLESRGITDKAVYSAHKIGFANGIRTIQKLLGHASLDSTQVYTHLSITDLKDVHKRCHPREKRCRPPPRVPAHQKTRRASTPCGGGRRLNFNARPPPQRNSRRPDTKPWLSCRLHLLT